MSNEASETNQTIWPLLAHGGTRVGESENTTRGGGGGEE